MFLVHCELCCLCQSVALRKCILKALWRLWHLAAFRNVTAAEPCRLQQFWCLSVRKSHQALGKFQSKGETPVRFKHLQDQAFYCHLQLQSVKSVYTLHLIYIFMSLGYTDLTIYNSLQQGKEKKTNKIQQKKKPLRWK